jgi:hypothetical protein
LYIFRRQKFTFTFKLTSVVFNKWVL